MNPDDVMHARLREAGERWRAATDTGAAVDLAAATSEVHTVTSPEPQHRRSWTAWVASVAAVLVLVAGVGFLITSRDNGKPSSRATAASGVTEKDWNLLQITDARGRSVAIAGAPTLRLDRGELTASDGCNHIAGHADIRGDRIVFGPLASTAIGCPSEFAGSTGAIAAVLHGTAGWRIEGGRLVLTGGGYTLRYAEEIAPGTPVGSWQLAGVADTSSPNGTASSSSDMAAIKVTITDSRILIHHRCYEYAGPVRVGTDRLEIGALTLQNALPCPSTGVQPIDGQVDDVLTGSVSWSMHRGSLALGRGATTLQFTRTPTTSPSDQPTSALRPPALIGNWALLSYETTSPDGSGSGGGASSTGGGSTAGGTGISLTANSIRIMTPCGVAAGDVAIGPGTLTITNRHVVSDHSCPADPWSGALATLDGQWKWTVSGPTLSLTFDGAQFRVMVLQFTRVS